MIRITDFIIPSYSWPLLERRVLFNLIILYLC